MKFVCCFISCSTISDGIKSSERGFLPQQENIGPTALYPEQMQGVSTEDPSWKNYSLCREVVLRFQRSRLYKTKVKFNHKCAHCGTIGHGRRNVGRVESTNGPIHNKGNGCGKGQWCVANILHQSIFQHYFRCWKFIQINGVLRHGSQIWPQLSAAGPIN